MAIAKLLQLIIELLRFGEGILFRVVCIASVNDGSLHLFVERMSVPKHGKFMVYAAFLAPGNEGIAQLVCMVVRKQPFDGCVDGIDIGLFRFLEIYVRQYFPHHRGNGYSAGNDVVAHLLFARIALQPVLVNDTQGFEFAAAHPRIEQDKQGARRGKMVAKFSLTNQPLA